MNRLNRQGWILLLLLPAFAACDRAKTVTTVAVPTLKPAWTFQHRWPTSSNLRSVRFITPSFG